MTLAIVDEKTSSSVGYRDVRAEATKPIAKRQEVIIGRDGKPKAPRKFHLSKDEINELKKLHEDGDILPNPQNKGTYWCILETLKSMGLDVEHPMDGANGFYTSLREFMKKIKIVDGKSYYEFSRDKAPATDKEDGAKDWNSRMLQNLQVLQRVNCVSDCNPYGLKLLQVGQKVLKTDGVVIDLFKHEDGTIWVRLNTNSNNPLKLKRARKTKVKSVKKVVKTVKVVKKVKSRKDRKAKTVKVPKTVTVPETVPEVTEPDSVTAVPAPEIETPTVVAQSEPAAEIPEAV